MGQTERIEIPTADTIRCNVAYGPCVELETCSDRCAFGNGSRCKTQTSTGQGTRRFLAQGPLKLSVAATTRVQPGRFHWTGLWTLGPRPRSNVLRVLFDNLKSRGYDFIKALFALTFFCFHPLRPADPPMHWNENAFLC